MNLKTLLLNIVLFFGGSISLFAQSFDYSVIGDEHPRILLKAGEEQKLIKTIQQHTELQSIHQKIIDYCDGLIIIPTQYYHIEGRRLHAAYTSARNLLYLSYAYRTTQDKKYSRRAEQELRALCNFTNWNPSHFLDTGTATLALGIAYDWLFHELTAETKAMVRRSIMDKGFEPSTKSTWNWFYTSNINWNSVCNTGLVYGALAIFEDEQTASKAIIEKCMETIHLPLQSYGPDGAYPEGYGYWQYGTGLQVLLHAVFESVFGTDNGLSQTPGFLESARYMLHMVGPSELCFNYSDCGNYLPKCIFPLFWFAKKTNDPSLLWWEKTRLEESRVSMDIYLPLYLTFILGTEWKTPKTPTPKMWVGKGAAPVILVRTGWDQQSVFFGAKGGTPKHSHAHMDNGSFVFDALGVRWAMDLGSQGYESLESKGIDLFNTAQNSPRWDVLRLNNWHHNTLTINGNKHNADGYAAIIKVFDKDSKRGALIDLSETFRDDLQKATRDISIVKNQYLEISDHITAKNKTTDVQWTMCTPASARIIEDRVIELTQDGKVLHLIVDAPKNIDMKIWSNDPEHDYDEPNPGTLRVGFVTRLKQNENAILKVRLIPQ